MNLIKEEPLLQVKLGSLRPGDCAEIVGFCLDEEADTVKDDALIWRNRFLHRLHEIGFLVGEKLEILNQSPFSQDPISIRIKNAVYAIRRSDANWIYVRMTEPKPLK